MHMLTEMIDFTASGIIKGSRVGKFVPIEVNDQ